MSTATKSSKLREEYELYRCMWRNAIAEEGANSSMARLAQTMVEEVQEELEAEEPRHYLDWRRDLPDLRRV